MILRKATIADIHAIMDIIGRAQASIKKLNIDQWQDGYPGKQIIEKDIEDGNSYVLLKDNKIVGTAAILFDGEKNYEAIYEGRWLGGDKYAAMHRVAVNSQFRRLGLASKIFQEAEKMCLKRGVSSVRIDTHEGNSPMQGLLKKNKYNYCGIIYLEDGSKRLAFEKLL
ncbi:MAG: GNAT family N-acetyltransferase [Clostridiales bacterium]|nr:GNAT family N-acetyltransferase [Clostridiales bacterium]